MNIEKIRALADILSTHGLTSLEFSEDDTRVRLERQSFTGTIQEVPVMAAVSAPAAPIAPAPPVAAPAPTVETVAEAVAENQALDFNQLTEVKSPLVGVFYSAPSPDAEQFVSIGSKVKKGDVLCVIEAMKLMNEITAEQDGEIADISVKNGDIVEFGQVLFKIR